MADTADLKSAASNSVPVQVWEAAPIKRNGNLSHHSSKEVIIYERFSRTNYAV